MSTYAIDYETYYDDEVNLKVLGNIGYTEHPEFDAYMVSIAGDDGLEFVGHPNDAPWNKIKGKEHTWLSHNRGFDECVHRKIMPAGSNLMPGEWHCTADLAAYMGFPRSLKGATLSAFGIDLSKAARNMMKGKKYETLDGARQQRMLDYAMEDSRWCLQIGTNYLKDWPDWEKKLSQSTTRMCWRGVPVDIEGVEESIKSLKTRIWKNKQIIPWAAECPDDVGLLSKMRLDKACRAIGVTPPKTTDQTSDSFEKWLAENNDKAPFVRAVSEHRKMNTLISKLETMRTRTNENGWMPYGLKYFGAHTGRDSGDSGWNPQNLPRGSMFGVDLRGLVLAPPGKRLVACDLAQIEPRVLALLAGDTKLLQHIRDCGDFYEAQARAMNLWTKPEPLRSDPEMRHTMKGLNLGLGYGMSANKYASITGCSIEEAQKYTSLYRKGNPLVTRFWKQLEYGMRQSIGDDFTITLHSGRCLRYRKVQGIGGLTATIPRGNVLTRLKFWHGTLCENAVQATARDIFMDRVLALEDAGVEILLRVHDEVVCLVDETSAESDAKEIEQIMSTPPAWLDKEFPLAAESNVAQKYTK